MRTFSPLRLAALVFPLLAVALIFGGPAGSVARADHTQGPLPAGPGVDLVYAKCQQCHPIRYVTESAGLPPFLWQDTLGLMQQLGLQVTEEEEAALYDYFVTYMGPDGPPEGSTDAHAESHSESDGSSEGSGDASAQTADDGSSEGSADGAAIYSANCTACHGGNGAGISGVFPPLAGHAPALAAADRSYPPIVLVHGLQGEITIQGESYRGVMPAWVQLSDTEIAAVIDHVMTSWGNAYPDGVEPYTAADIAEARELDISSAQVLERRPPVDD